jgi:phytoene dehydrogenase-like protein
LLPVPWIKPTAHDRPSSRRDAAAFAREMDALGTDAPLLFGMLGGALWSLHTAKLLAREAWRRGLRNLAGWFGEMLTPARNHLETTYHSDAVRALWAPGSCIPGSSPKAPIPPLWSG